MEGGMPGELSLLLEKMPDDFEINKGGRPVIYCEKRWQEHICECNATIVLPVEPLPAQ
jgi:hypothetical protein